MSWRRHLRDIAVAGGLVGCAAHTVDGGGTTTTTSGHGGATTSSAGTGGNPVPSCNADPDPCCPCSNDGQGGYGGAACVDKSVAFRALKALALLLFEGAVGESVSVRLFRAGRRAAREPCARAALGAIMRDEARHATVSWLASAELLAALPGEARGALEQDLARSFGAFERAAALPALQSLDAGRRVDPALRELGVLSYEDRVEAFYAGIERVAIPRLTRLGFDAPRLWSERYRT